MERKTISPRWAVDGAGRIGRVTELDEKSGQYFGTLLEGGTWGSKVPLFLHPDTQAWLEARYRDPHAARPERVDPEEFRRSPHE